MNVKGNFWRKIFRCGYNSKSAVYNGYMAKTDAKTTRTQLKNFLNRFYNE